MSKIEKYMASCMYNLYIAIVSLMPNLMYIKPMSSHCRSNVMMMIM